MNDNVKDIAACALDNMLTAVIMLDHGLNVKYANNATEQIFRLSPKKFLGKKIDRIFDYTNFDFDRLLSCHSRDLGYTDYDVTFVIEASPVMAEVTVSPVSNQNSDCDILLELRKVNLPRRMNYDMAQYSQQEAARELVRGLAHEIKNPLSGLRGAAQLLERQFKNHSEVKEYTTVIIEQADRLKNLVNRLLGPQKAAPFAMTNIHVILEHVRKLVQMELPDNIRIVRDYDPSIPELMMEPDQIEQTVLNIVHNSVLALKEQKNPRGVITIKTRTAYRAPIYENVVKLALVIKISDNGPGIPSDIQDKIFYPLVSRRKGGTGLGLAIAQNIINQHNGKIECASWQGYTEFTIYIPIKE